jgi:aryl-alcohol dehydrogenase-like predicted oxidoreductase
VQHMTFGRNNGLRVPRYALGTGTFGTRWGMGAEPDEARRILDRYADAGGTFLDTADSYQFGQSEEILGDLLKSTRSRFTLATKFTNGLDGSVLGTGNGRRNMRTSVEASLRRLGTDYVDLLWVHFPDTVTPVEEIVHGLDDLVRAGKVLYGGLSNFPAWRTSRAATLADLRGLSPIAAVQYEYSLAERTADREVLPMADALGLGSAQWSPLAGGLLTGKYRTSDEGRLTTFGNVIHTEDTARKTAVVDAVLKIAEAIGVPPAQVATAWLCRRNEGLTTAALTIIGPRTTAQLEDYLAALDLDLDDEHYALLDEVSRVDLGEPHDAITKQRDTVLGGAGFLDPLVTVA